MPEDIPSADTFMAQAIEEARRAIGRTCPNPPVGAVIVRQGAVVGRGFTQPAGRPHAEAEAIRAAGAAAAGADIYVTLEPCSHFGRTPPCVDAILAAGLRRVFVGAIDPNPLVCGQGVAKLRAAGVEVRISVLESECERLIRPFVRYITTGRPFIVLKAAATLDGKLATRTGDSKWVSGPTARHLAHVWRDECDAVLVGARTLRQDNPALTTRLDSPVAGRVPRTPLRVVLLGREPPPQHARLFDTTPGPVLAIAPESAHPSLPSNVETLRLPEIDGRVDPVALIEALGRRCLLSVLVEGGAAVHASLLRAGVADEVRLFLAPRISGGDGISWVGPLGVTEMSRAWRLDGTTIEHVGEDLLVTGTPRAAEG